MSGHVRQLLLVLLGAYFALAAGIAQSGSDIALLNAIIDRQPQRVAILLDQGVSPEVASDTGEYEGKTALMWAAETGQDDIVRMLLDYGAMVDRGNAKGGTALMYAAVAGQTEAIRELVAAGANPNHRVRHGWTPLLLATAKGHVDSVRALTLLGADPATRDVYGWTLLMHAAEREDTDMVMTLLDLGLDPRATDEAGTSPIVLARRSNNPVLGELLEGATARR